MSTKAQAWKCLALPVLVLFVTLPVGIWTTLLAADVQCRFKAESETTEIHVIIDGKPLWKGAIEKFATEAISIPEGPFTVISKLINRRSDVIYGFLLFAVDLRFG